jgi:predicted nucleotidyltransferase
MTQAKLTLPRVNDALLQEIVARIVRVTQPDKIILFGSRGRGDARQNSDIDLLVIAPSTEPRYRRAVPLYGALSDIMIPMDIMVYSPEEVEEWSQVQQAFVTTAVREGKVLYENPSRPGERMAAQG